MKIQMMTVDEWAKVTDNPRQRNTLRHAKKIMGDFSPWLEQGEIVQAARLPGGRLYKLNGHTRSHGWNNRLIHRPLKVQVEIFDAMDVEEVIRMYHLYDNVRYSETPSDLVSGCFHQLEYEVKSAYMRRGSISMAVKYLAMECLGIPVLNGKGSLFDAIKECFPELVKIDNILVGCNVADVPAWILAAMIVSLRKYGDQALEFWIIYLDRNAEELNTNPIMMLRTAKVKAKEGLATGSKSGYRDCLGKALNAVGHWTEGRAGVRLHRITHLDRWINE